VRNITFTLASMQAAAQRRPPGYLDDCLSVGTVSPDGASVTFTEEQFEALKAKYRDGYVAKSAGPSRQRCLAGTALKALLSRFGINADEKGCKCKSRAAHMDAAGCQWVEENIDTVVGWLREEAAKRGLPFVDVAGRMLIRRAIRNARRAAAS
jgi:hypothetical protein